MADTPTVHYNGIGFTGLLFIVFLILKLTHVIGWSWWWVTCPLWGGAAIVLAIVALILGIIAIVAACRK